MRVGIEVGGTFTDLVAVNDAGRLLLAKVPSVPAAPDEGAFAALAEAGLAVAGIEDLAHGSTVATNAVLERKGARVAFVTTAGFRDILAMGRHNRARVYDLAYRKPRPPVRRRACFEVEERVLADGSVLKALDVRAVEDALCPVLIEGGFEAVAVCLLNAYANPVHEEALADVLARRCPGVEIALSSAVAREFREYERASTTVLSAYVQPIVNRYLQRFEARLEAGGFAGRFSVMQSNGGCLPARGMRKNAVTALLSGPAAGVIGAAGQAARSGFHDLITFDMGGTSTDICLVSGGRPDLAAEMTLDGLPVRMPAIDIVTVGAGGGSIVWIDDGGMLRAGPHSAGADPGPACYGRGGTLATVTDAHAIRRTLRPDALLGGHMGIDAAASRRAFAPLARRLAMSLEEAADAAIRVADASIVRAMQIVSTERGRDPRDFALAAFGGAGPLHAARVAGDLGVATVVVPPHAGVVSAWGLLAADYLLFDTVTRRLRVDDAAPAGVRAAFAEMKARLLARFAALGLADAPRLGFHADMRFVGQAFEVAVELDPEALAGLDAGALARRFVAEHRRVFMHGGSGANPIEIVAFRLSAAVAPATVPPLAERSGPQALAPWTFFEAGVWHEGVGGPRAALATGGVLDGPALLEDATSTVAIPAGWQATCDERRNLVLRRRS